MADAAPPAAAPAPGARGPAAACTTALRRLTPVASSGVLGTVPAGTLTDFQSNVPAYSCLNAPLDVCDNMNGKAVAEAVMPTDCLAQDFQLP